MKQKYKLVRAIMLTTSVFMSAIFATSYAQAGHLFTQASSNAPTWIQSGQGISIDQYGTEGGSASGAIKIYFAQPGTVPSGADTSDNTWWTWSSGDVMEINLPLTSGTYKYSIAYDSSSSCAYDFCGDTSGSGSTASALGSGIVLPAHSGERNTGGYTASDTAFQWSIVSLAGEFSLGGYRIYTNAGTIDGTGSGPLDQSSVVSAAEAVSGSGPSTRDINASGDVLSNLVDAGGSALNSVFDGGELIIDQDLSTTNVASFAIKSGTGNAQLNVVSGDDHSVGSKFTDNSGDTGVLEKVGAGTLVLTNTANDYTGGTTVSAGTLEIASDSVLGATSGGVTLNGGTLATTANMSSARAVSLGASNGTVDTATATTLTLSGVVSGSGSLTKTGAGVLTVTGTNTYTGGTTVSGGSLRGAVGSLQGNIVNNAAVEFAQGTDATYADVVSGSGSLTKTGAGVLTVTGTNTYTGGTTVSGGSLRGAVGSLQGNIVNNAAVEFAQGTDATYADVVSGSGSLTKTGAGVLTVTGTNTYTGGTTVSGGSLRGAVGSLQGNIVNNAAVEFAQGTDATYADVVSGSGSLTKTGAGVLTVTGTNTYTGGTTVSGGSLRGAVGSLQGNIVNNSAVEFAQGTDATYADVVSGSGSLTKTGAGVLTVTGTNTYTGGTTVSGGSLRGAVGSLQGNIVNNAAVEFAQGTDATYADVVSGSGSLTKTGAGVLTVTGTNTYTGGTTVSGGSLRGAVGSLQGNIVNNAAVEFAQGTDATYADVVSGSGSLTKTGAGVLTVTGTNTYTGGTTVSGGSLRGAVGSLQGNIVNNAAVEFAQGTDATYADVVSGSGSLTKTGAGVLTVTGTNTYTGGTTVSGGSLRGAVGSLQGNIVNNAAVEFAQGTDATYADVVSGSGSLTKTGAGVLTVTGTNTYTGGTTVSAGTLDLDGSLASEVTVAIGARIEGTGTANRLSSYGTVAPGNSPGTLENVGPVVFYATSNLIVELDGLTYDGNDNPGTYDRLAVKGTSATDTFTAGGALTPVLRGISDGISGPSNNDLVPVIGNTFRIVTTEYATGVSGEFTSITDPDYTDPTSGMPTNTRFDVLYGGNYVDLVLTPDDLSTYAAAYATQNMVNAADAFDGIRPAQGTNGTTDKDKFFNGLYGLTAQETAVALLQASGEVHAFALSDARDAWRDGLGTVRSSSQGAGDYYWIDMSGYNLAVDEDTIASAYDSKTRKFWIGSDVYQDRSTTYGFALGVSESELSMANSGSADTTTYSLAAYMRGAQGAFEYDGLVSLNRSNIDTNRSVSLSTGSLSNTSSSDVRGLAMSAQLGYRYDVAPSLVSGLAWIKGDLDNTRTDTFTEDGSTVTALTVNGYEVKSAKVSVGYTLSGKIPNSGVEAGLWSFGVGAAKDVSRGMPDVSRTMSLHGASWSVSVPKAGDVTKFVSGGIAIPLGNDAVGELSLSAAKRDGALSKSAAFGFSAKW